MGKMMLYCGVVVALAAGAAGAAYEYGGQWKLRNIYPQGIDLNAANGYIYFIGYPLPHNPEAYIFTPAGSFVSSWDTRQCMPSGLACAPNGDVYVSNACEGDPDYIRYFTSTGSKRGEWVNPYWKELYAVAVAGDGTVFITETNGNMLWHCAAAGKYLNSWGDLLRPKGVAVAPNGNVYVADTNNHMIKYYTAGGVILGSWGGFGVEDGYFREPYGVAVAGDGTVFVADQVNNRVQYFSATGLYLGQFGEAGAGPGQLDGPWDLTVTPTASRVYVSDTYNNRIQYFDATYVNVQPASLGKIKALFR